MTFRNALCRIRDFFGEVDAGVPAVLLFVFVLVFSFYIGPSWFGLEGSESFSLAIVMLLALLGAAAWVSRNPEDYMGEEKK